jgi:hypothetical protein
VREADVSPLLEAIAREWLAKTQQAGRGLADAMVICELWRLSVALQLLVVRDMCISGPEIHSPIHTPSIVTHVLCDSIVKQLMVHELQGTVCHTAFFHILH